MNHVATGETLTLASHFAGLEWEAIPVDVRQEAKHLLLDTMGCAISATDTESGPLVRQLAVDMGARSLPDGSDFLGRAYEIGRLANVMDLDEYYAYCHFGAATVASALAMARWRRVSGKELLTAIVAGFEFGGQIALGIGPEFKVKDGKASGRLDVWGVVAQPVLAGAAAAARLLRLTPQQTSQAYGLAASNMPIPIGGKWSSELDLPNTKYGDMGWCAMSGVFGAVSAMRGSTAVPTILDGEKGLIRIVQGGDNNSRRFLAHLGNRWHLRGICYKRWPVCGWIQYPLAALDALVAKHGITVDEVSDVVVEVVEGAAIPRFTNPQPQGFVSLQFSIPHAVAMRLMQVRSGPKWLSVELAESASVKALRDRVRVEAHTVPQSYTYADPFAVPDEPQGIYSAVRVTTNKGTFREESSHIWGHNYHPQVRMDYAHMEEKFRSLVAPDAANRIMSLLGQIEQLDDTSGLVDAFYAALA
ncbi:2-methylcitrate dehydratase PrpD [Bradyrhizobium sp. IAR9]|uniref:MmgE/PrpD family protein n=1 Tax=Bradyrhizobium sp. IAR9 TaxID=2663841 RepID=UPI0015CC5DD2|nr:MmgE/PrpD family protein [Bradyrhizobium sp. IAR9]NYG45382.1 2-methylcitrate dehydratase PrpD [Bradyrhizobium sp. IAR9]